MATSEREAQLCARFEFALQNVDAERNLVRRGRYLHATGIVQIGETRFLLKIVNGHVEECTRSIPLFQPSDFILKGTVEAWDKFWEAIPAAGWHDIFALAKKGRMSLEGNMPAVFAHLQYLKDLVALPRLPAPH